MRPDARTLRRLQSRRRRRGLPGRGSSVKINVAALDKTDRSGANVEEIVKSPNEVQVGAALPGKESDHKAGKVIRVERRETQLSAVPIEDLPKVVDPAPLLFGPFFGWLADRMGAGKVIAPRSVANLLTSALFWITPWFAGTALLGLMMGIARGVDEMGKAAFKPT
ncbi:MAG TPA: hypothetical protein VKG02_21775 [Blastocatellia bacterium]|nr:hypothetical protein [Blastocatellia bacterium]